MQRARESGIPVHKIHIIAAIVGQIEGGNGLHAQLST